MSTEIPILYREIQKEFKARMADPNETGFVERPASMERLGKRRRNFVQDARANNRQYVQRLDSDAAQLISLYGIDSLVAKDLTLRAWDIENRLKEEGAVFGNRVFNFALDRLVITPEEDRQIISASVNSMNSVDTLSGVNISTNVQLNAVEAEFESLKLTPNAARIDIVLTPDGPKVIEINSQWVDAIGALSGFISVYDSPTKGLQVLEDFSKNFPAGTKLAILNLKQTSGSRSDGAEEELNLLSKRLVKTKKNRIINCEVIDPNKIRLNYLDRFNCFYINCDPKYFSGDVPDWVEYVLRRVDSNKNAIFPRWRPTMDKKNILSLMCNDPKNSVISTLPLSDFDQSRLFTDNIVVKGDGYSLNSVAVSGQPNFQDFVGYANQEPQNYVVQPFVESIRRDVWVFDSSSNRVKLIKDAYTKINVWIVNRQILGMLATFSDSPLISDKGYNVPLLVKGSK